MSHSLTRIAIAYLNLAAATECFNMDITQVPGIIATVANTWNDTRDTPAQRVQKMLDERSLVNWVQIWFWGFNPKMTREFVLAAGLSRGDTFEVQAMPIPRVNISQPTCLQTGVVPPSAQLLKDWTLTGNPPAALDNFLFANTGYRLDRGLGACTNPELRNDDWADASITPAPRFGDRGDLLVAEPSNPAFQQTFCVSIPARNDSLQFVPSVKLFVRAQGKYVPGQQVIVLIHGTSASENYWRDTGRLLSRRYYVLGIDLRGHGRSQVTPATVPFAGGFRYTYEAFADDIKAILDARNITEKIVFAGISIGAGIGIRFAAKYPTRVDRLVTISGTSLFRCVDGTTNGSVPTCAPGQPGGLAPWITGVASTPITLLPEDVLSGCNVSSARDKINQNRQANTSGVAVPSLITYSQTEDQTPLLSQIKAPTLIMHGLGDPTLGVQAAAQLNAGIVNSVRLNFVNRGHLIPITARTDVANNILRFIQGHTFPEISRVVDDTCDISPSVAPESDFAKCV